MSWSEYFSWLGAAFRLGFDPGSAVLVPTEYYDRIARLGFIGVLWTTAVVTVSYVFTQSELTEILPSTTLKTLGVLFGITVIWMTNELWTSTKGIVALWAPFGWCAAAIQTATAFALPMAMATLVRQRHRVLAVLVLLTIVGLFFAGAACRVQGMAWTKGILLAIELGLLVYFVRQVAMEMESPAGYFLLGLGGIAALYLDRRVFIDPHTTAWLEHLGRPVGWATYLGLQWSYPVGFVAGTVAALSGNVADERHTVAGVAMLAFAVVLLMLLVLMLVQALPGMFGDLINR